MPVICDTVDVLFVYHDQEIARGTMPAYTRGEWDLKQTISQHLQDYVNKSKAEPYNGMSVGDFVMYLATQAAQEPTTIEENN